MEFKIENCNNIALARIELEENTLNIKYGPNGTGKSTLAKAIELGVGDPSGLAQLTPFRLLEDNPDSLKPSIEGADQLSSVMVFNDKYISQFAFKKDELLDNSFEIFVRTENYEQRMQSIEELVSDITDTFKNDKKLDEAISDLEDLSGCFGQSQAGYSKAGALHKGIGKEGNKIENIPTGLEHYEDYLKNDSKIPWIQWQIKGDTFLDITDKCPYCTEPATENKKQSIRKIGETYNARNIEHLLKVIELIERLEDYFSDDTREVLAEIKSKSAAFSDEEINFLIELKKQIDILKDRLKELQRMTFFTFEDIEKVTDRVGELKINLDALHHLKSELTLQTIGGLNNSLDKILKKAGELQGAVNLLKIEIEKRISQNKAEIEQFLSYAGYKYQVDVVGDAENRRLVLKHKDSSTALENGDQHLSYGERNAFSLVLFMFECISRKPDLIILDDPISSFDNTKKFAISETLFRGEVSLRGKTVVLLTHDFEPIIDILKVKADIFNAPKPVGSFLQLSRGHLTELSINSSNVMTFGEVCRVNINDSDDDLIKLVYLRRFSEITASMPLVYELISNLFHHREVPVIFDEVEREMTREEIEQASQVIASELKIDDFSYENTLARIVDPQELSRVYSQCRSGYEKLQIFRLTRITTENRILQKALDEAFHIENEYVCQLNPRDYEMIPESMIEECDQFMDFEYLD